MRSSGDRSRSGWACARGSSSSWPRSSGSWPSSGRSSSPRTRSATAAMAPLMFGALLVLVLADRLRRDRRRRHRRQGHRHAGRAVGHRRRACARSAPARPGIETVFFTLVIAGRVFGPGFGFALGCTTLFASALITGGVGPWMPYQMFGCAWVGLFAGLLPPATRPAGGAHARRLRRAAPATSSASCSTCRSGRSPSTRTAPSPTCPARRSPPTSTATCVFDATTSLGWDTGRAITNFLHPAGRPGHAGHLPPGRPPGRLRGAGELRP